MTKNPLVNAMAALLYILLIVSVMFFAPKNDAAMGVLAPVVALSLFTLSAAVMGYLFLYQPIQLYFDGKKKQAVDLFLKTVAVFGAITVAVLLLAFSGILGKKEVQKLANPASVYCGEQGGELSITKDTSGGEVGICTFKDGSSCEEWQFFRGECLPGNLKLVSSVSYRCDDNKHIEASYFSGPMPMAATGEMPIPSGEVRLTLSDGRKMNLPQTISASGIRYANSDESVVFWSKGETAFMTEGSQETYSSCNQL